jgi:hypothetical protein
LLVTEVNYFWPEHQMRTASADELKSRFSRYTTEQLKAVQEGRDEALRQSLLGDGLLLRWVDRIGESTREKSNGIKFYSLVRHSDIYSSDRVREVITNYLSRADDGVGEATLYSSSGVAPFLLKGVTEDYFRISKFVTDLVLQLSLVQPYTESLWVTEPDYLSVESDDVDFTKPIDPEIAAVVQSMLNQKTEALSSLADLERDEFITLLAGARASKLFELDSEGFLIELFSAKLHSKKKALGVAKSVMRNIFPELESRLRDFVQRLLMSQVEGRWFDELQRYMESVGVRKNSRPKKLGDMSMYEMACVLGAIDKSTGDVTRGLGDAEWESVLRTAVDWRNLFAHGLDQADWYASTRFLIDLLPLYYGLAPESRELKEVQ